MNYMEEAKEQAKQEVIRIKYHSDKIEKMRYISGKIDCI